MLTDSIKGYIYYVKIQGSALTTPGHDVFLFTPTANPRMCLVVATPERSLEDSTVTLV